MNIVFFGDSSQIAKGLIKIFTKKDNDYLKSFIRDQLILKKWIDQQGFKKIVVFTILINLMSQLETHLLKNFLKNDS